MLAGGCNIAMAGIAVLAAMLCTRPFVLELKYIVAVKLGDVAEGVNIGNLCERNIRKGSSCQIRHSPEYHTATRLQQAQSATLRGVQSEIEGFNNHITKDKI
jgi:hypothetical protein